MVQEFVMSEEDKVGLKSSIVPVFERLTNSREERPLRKTYCEIVHKILQSDFPARWPDLLEVLIKSADQAADITGLSSVLQILYLILEKYLADKSHEQKELWQIVNIMFPLVERVANTDVKGFFLDDRTKNVCYLCLKCLQSAVISGINTSYFNLDRLQIWMYFLKKLLDYPFQSEANPGNWLQVLALESTKDWKIRRSVSEVAVLFLQKLKHTSKSSSPEFVAMKTTFFSQYFGGILAPMTALLSVSQKQFVAPRVVAESLKFLNLCIGLDDNLERLVFNAESLDHLVFEILLPLLTVNQKDSELWSTDARAFLLAQDSKVDSHNVIKSASKDLFLKILEMDDPNIPSAHPIQPKSQSTRRGGSQHPTFGSRYLEYLKTAFAMQTNPRSKQPLSEQDKDYLLTSLYFSIPTLEKKTQTSQMLADLLEELVYREYGCDSLLVKFRVSCLINQNGISVLKNETVLLELCRSLETAIKCGHDVVRVSAIIALNRALVDKRVLSYFSNQVTPILETIISCMKTMYLKDLVYAAEGIIKDLHQQTLPFAGALINHFEASFYQYIDGYHDSELNDSDDEEIYNYDDGESDGEENGFNFESLSAAEACLEALLTLQQLELAQPERERVSEATLGILCDIFVKHNSDLLGKGLEVLNSNLYKSEQLSDAVTFFYPIVMYLILAGFDHAEPLNNANLAPVAQNLPPKLQQILAECDFTEFDGVNYPECLACILNYIKKLGPAFFQLRDFYGTTFFDLLKKVLASSFAYTFSEKTESGHLNIMISLRIIMELMVLAKHQHFEVPELAGFVEGAFGLANKKPSEQTTLQVLQTVSMCLYYNPAQTLQVCQQLNCLGQYFDCLYSRLGDFSDESARERVLYGLVALLELLPHQEALQVTFVY